MLFGIKLFKIVYFEKVKQSYIQVFTVYSPLSLSYFWDSTVSTSNISSGLICSETGSRTSLRSNMNTGFKCCVLSVHSDKINQIYQRLEREVFTALPPCCGTYETYVQIIYMFQIYDYSDVWGSSSRLRNQPRPLMWYGSAASIGSWDSFLFLCSFGIIGGGGWLTVTWLLLSGCKLKRKSCLCKYAARLKHHTSCSAWQAVFLASRKTTDFKKPVLKECPNKHFLYLLLSELLNIAAWMCF